MNEETISLPRLISLVANGAGVDPAVARRFLHELFATIEETLVAGEKVEVKGVGEFVRSDNPAAPVVYVPDARLAEIANEPFSIFTAVEVNDGAEEEIAAVGSSGATSLQPAGSLPLVGEDRPRAVAETAQPLEQPASSEKPEMPSEPVAESENAEGEAAGETREVVDADVEDRVAEPADAEPADAEPANRPVSTFIPPEPEPEPTLKSPLPFDDYGERHSHHGHSHHHGHHHGSSRHHHHHDSNRGGNNMMWLLVGVMIGVIVGLVAGYFAGKTMARYEFDEDEMDLSAYTDSIAAAEPDPMSVDSVPVSVEEHVAAPTVDTVAHVAPAAEQFEATAGTKKAEPVYDTVTSKRYLSILAKEHYGVKNYWVFIYEANPGLGNPDNVKNGTRVLIPSKESFEEATKAETDAKAARLMGQILSRYK